MNAAFPVPPSGKPAVVNGLSVDVEDWFQVGAFEDVIARGEWDAIKTRVEDNVYRVIDLFAEADVSATFFTLGWVAKRHPNMIRRIADAGHELASHGYDHARVFTFTRREFAEDIRKAREVIDGPFAETRELVAGYWIWEVKDMDEAVKAAGHTQMPLYGWTPVTVPGSPTGGRSANDTVLAASRAVGSAVTGASCNGCCCANR